jgi:hypothetical protein
MGHEWIVDVISDLKQYARTHGLLRLEAQLEHSVAIARVDMCRKLECPFILKQGEHTGNRQLPAIVGTSGSA